MYCSNCGNGIDETARFCSHCGTNQKQEQIKNEDFGKKADTEKCEKCNHKKRNVYIGKEFTGNKVCPVCDISPQLCPNCGLILRTDKAQQCTYCNASWREITPTVLKGNIVKTSFSKPIEKEPTNEVKCPRCNSNTITANKKGFGLGKAVVGGILTGGVGLLGGFIGSNKIKLTCLNCGHTWKPKKY